MGIKLASSILERDVKKESSKLGKQAAELSKAKSFGGGIGGLLGAVVGVALAPVTGGASLALAGAIGGGLGTLIGSKIGGASKGGQESLYGGKFLQTSRSNIADQMAQQEGMSVLKGAATGAFSAGNIAGGIEAFKAGGLGELGKYMGMPGMGGSAVTKVPGGGVIEKATGKAGMMLDGQWIGSAAQPLTGGGGLGKVLGGMGKVGKGVYGAADKFLAGGMLPGGQPAGEGWLGGLMGSQTGQPEYTAQSGDSPGGILEGGGSNILDIISGGVPDTGVYANVDPVMKQRVQQYISSGWAKDDTIDEEVWQMMGGQ